MNAIPVFDIDEIAVITKDGLHKNMPVLIKRLCHTYKTPYNTDIFYDCETTDDPPKIIVVNEKDLISFDQYLDDMDLPNDLREDEYDLSIFNNLEDIFIDLELELEGTDLTKKCECGAEKTRIGNHSTWCPKYE